MGVSIIAVAVSYLLGNISPAILLGRIYEVDIKKEGSGNAGTTNVLRVLGKKAAVITLFIDVLKGAAAVILGSFIGNGGLALICGVAVFCGHIWPAFYKFKGGKGVATALGVVLTATPVLGAATLAVALLIIAVTRRVSAGSVVWAVVFPVAATLYDPDLMVWSIVMGVIIIITHRQNIVRLFKGQEPKIRL